VVEQPFLRIVLADLAFESEAALVFAMRVAGAVDAAPHDDTDESRREAAFARIATAIGKYWICKRAPAFVNEAQECLGGNGYVEESILPRLYRQAPLNSIWEGSGNIQCLDVLRALAKEPETGTALWNELLATTGDDADHAGAIERLRAPLAGNVRVEEAAARTFVEDLALALEGSMLLRAGSPVARTFCRSRLGNAHGLAFGTLPAGVNCDEVLVRAF
jgi:putative acyl-CoA dehydrogenase